MCSRTTDCRPPACTRPPTPHTAASRRSHRAIASAAPAYAGAVGGRVRPRLVSAAATKLEPSIGSPSARKWFSASIKSSTHSRGVCHLSHGDIASGPPPRSRTGSRGAPSARRKPSSTTASANDDAPPTNATKTQVEEILSPVLIKGLTALAQARPKDPVTFLAQWLLANKPAPPVGPPRKGGRAFDANPTLTQAQLQSLDHLKEEFRKADASGDGELDAGELKLLLSTVGLNVGAADVSRLLAQYDADKSGKLSESEFLVLAQRELALAAELSLYASAFKSVDGDNSGEIDRSEMLLLMERLGHPADPAEVDGLIAKFDVDSSGKLSFDEFLEVVKTGLVDVSDETRGRARAMPPHVVGATLKFLFLLFSSPSLYPLDDWVFTSRGHLIKATHRCDDDQRPCTGPEDRPRLHLLPVDLLCLGACLVLLAPLFWRDAASARRKRHSS